MRKIQQGQLCSIKAWFHKQINTSPSYKTDDNAWNVINTDASKHIPHFLIWMDDIILRVHQDICMSIKSTWQCTSPAWTVKTWGFHPAQPGAVKKKSGTTTFNHRATNWINMHKPQEVALYQVNVKKNIHRYTFGGIWMLKH